jgi:hypothetical protein
VSKHIARLVVGLTDNSRVIILECFVVTILLGCSVADRQLTSDNLGMCSGADRQLTSDNLGVFRRDYIARL